ncbi:KH domain-containing, RNA-binding, signal transduction-associated protein 3-like isoform X2 [Chironomus tepperi]|uniref:KH domain-containing, RNA-binding, signal transduction-associated protein 3-like isoform X2 n=1 Tax=Chironomus tepperi TaxID=113505 RepID=UPI00391F73C4
MDDYYESDFKRRGGNDEEDESNLEGLKNYDYIKELIKERSQLDSESHASRLLDQEIQNAKASGKPFRDQRYVDVYREKQIRLVVKVIVPVKDHPKFNFVGKLLGPKGNSMRRLQEETLCKMAILGRGSMKDKKKEEELRQAADPKYAHLNDDLHVEISAIGPPSECYARIAYALAEVRKYLIPDSNDTIRQEQLREIMEGGLGEAAIAKIKQKAQYKNHVSTSERPMSSRTPTVVPPKTKILSILDRARIAMEESYKTSEPSAYHEHHPYEETYEAHHHHPYPYDSHAVHRPPSYRYESVPAPEYQYHHPREPTYAPVKSRSSWKESVRERHGHSSVSHSHRSEHSERSLSSRYRHEPYARIEK